jgi:predicted transcriptional regulator
MNKLTQQEEEIMLHIWSLENCFVKDVLARIPEPQPPYTTVASIINNLKHKGYVTAKRMGNSYMYTPAIKQSEYKRNFISNVVRNYFANSYKEMVSFFTQEEKLSAEDLKEIIELIEKGKEN